MYQIQIEQCQTEAVRYLLKQAFGRSEEASLVEALRERNAIRLSLVALVNQELIGYIAFSPVVIGEYNSNIRAVGLAPLGVSPAYQRQGIGSSLVKKGLSELLSLGYDAAVVLGEPAFYQRLGFETSTKYGIYYSPEIPEQYFMVTELRPGVLSGISGKVEYQPEFVQF